VNNIYRQIERGFEKLASFAIALLGNFITFIIAFCTILFWFTTPKFYTQNIHAIIGDVILGVAFLSLFIIQKIIQPFLSFTSFKG
jgi:hypothetical protein